MVAVLLVGASLAATAQGQVVSGQLTASELTVAGSFTQTGLGRFVYLERNSTGGLGVPQLSLAGQRITTTQSTLQGYALQTPPVAGQSYGARTSAYQHSIDQALGQGGPESHDVTGATLAFDSAQPRFVVNVFPLQGSLQQTGTGQAAEVEVFQQPELSSSGIIEHRVGGTSSPDSDPEASSWTTPYSQDPQLVWSSTSAATLSLRGDFVLEVVGLSGHLHGTEGDFEVKSSQTDQTTGPDGSPASYETQVFLHVEVRDGSLSFGGSGIRAQWSGLDFDTFQSAGHAELKDARGFVAQPDGTSLRISEASYALPAPQRLGTGVGDQTVLVQQQATGPDGTPVPQSAAVRPADSLVLGMLAGAAVLLVGAGATFLVFRRLQRPPLMADVEAALEAGQFRRAARDAARILRRKPGAEDAAISRAVALSKNGQHRKVVREVEDLLQTQRPSDGVLHYVLGVACHTLGRTEQARTAFAEAVRLTPALLKDVQQKLGEAATPSSPPTTLPRSTGEPHGYA